MEFKSKTYTLESQLHKTQSEFNILKAENEQLRHQCEQTSAKQTVSVKSDQTPTSIKHKLNPFALAKTIANKVESRAGQSPKDALMNNDSFAHKLQSQECEFIKTNEMLKREIALLNSKIEKLELVNSEILSQKNEPVRCKQNDDLQENDNSELFKRIYDLLLCLNKPMDNNDTTLLDESGNYEQLFKQQFHFELENVCEDSDLWNTVHSFALSLHQYIDETDDEKNSFKILQDTCVSIQKCHHLQIAKLKKLIVLLSHNLKRYHKLYADLLTQNDNLKQQNILIENKNSEFDLDFDELQRDNEQLRKQIISQQNEFVLLKSKLQQNQISSEDLLNKLKFDYESHIKQVEKEKDNAQQQISLLQTKLSESVNERKISEKKGFKIIKELKKQLNSEKSRANKLQNILNSELDSNGEKYKNSFDTTLVQYSDTLEVSDKCSSSGSWSYMNDPSLSATSNNKRQESVHSEFSDIEIFESPKTSNANLDVEIIECAANCTKKKSQMPSMSSLNSVNLEQENVQLLARISVLQQEKWRLEEQVNQLEHETHKLVNELVEKNQLIRHYCIEGRAGVPQSPSTPEKVLNQRADFSSYKSAKTLNNSVLKVVTFLKEKSEIVGNGDSFKQMLDVNRKLQRMVEEILTKNMHLQSNLEEMSNELMSVKQQLHQCKQEDNTHQT